MIFLALIAAALAAQAADPPAIDPPQIISIPVPPRPKDVSPVPPRPQAKRDSVDQSRSLHPKGNPGAWATNADYPPLAMREGREGTTGFRLIVNPEGRPTNCQIITSSGHADIDNQTCKLLMRRASFDPALDAAGSPATGTYSNRVRWKIPVPAVSQFDPGSDAVSFIVGTDGKVRDCERAKSSNTFKSVIPSTMCEIAGKIDPYLDADGNAVERQVRIKFTIDVDAVGGSTAH